jgi:hypothetical protein
VTIEYLKKALKEKGNNDMWLLARGRGIPAGETAVLNLKIKHMARN